MLRSLADRVALALLPAAVAAGFTACSGKTPGAAAGQDTARAGRPGAQGAAASGAPGGGRVRSITLSPSDVAKVSVQPIEEAIPVTGNLRAIESMEVRSQLEGDVTAVYAREGDHVRAGQVLVRFEPSQQQSDLQSAEADRASAQTDVSTAQWNYDQSKELFKAGAIAERDLKVAEQTVSSTKARLAAADARIHATGIAERYTRAVASADGTIDKRSVEPGEHLARNTLMFTIVRNQTMELAAQLPERRAAGIKVGQRVHFSTSLGQSMEGAVARISPTIDPATRTLTVYMQVPNPGGAIKSGSFASGRVVNRVVGGSLVIPIPALHYAADSSRFVYRIDGQTIASAPVDLGIVDDVNGIAQVTKGLNAGDQIIVGNVGTIGRGMQVEILGGDRGAGGGRRTKIPTGPGTAASPQPSASR
ncbi:MAG: efflux RND transporter periplasmic adaptor subunit [Gemmatimonadaceae bacterium]